MEGAAELHSRIGRYRQILASSLNRTNAVIDLVLVERVSSRLMERLPRCELKRGRAILMGLRRHVTTRMCRVHAEWWSEEGLNEPVKAWRRCCAPALCGTSWPPSGLLASYGTHCLTTWSVAQQRHRSQTCEPTSNGGFFPEKRRQKSANVTGQICSPMQMQA